MPHAKRSPLSRREFGRVAAALATLSVASPWLPAAEQKKPVPPQEAVPGTAAKEAPSAEAAALAGIVRARHGTRLDDAAIKEIARGIDGSLKAAAALRKVSLQNSDGPSFVFRAWRRPGD